jgi:hypothetical protein
VCDAIHTIRFFFTHCLTIFNEHTDTLHMQNNMAAEGKGATYRDVSVPAPVAIHAGSYEPVLRSNSTGNKYARIPVEYVLRCK